MPTLVAQPRPVTRNTGRWWWRPRVRSALIVGALLVITLAARTAAHLETDWMWFNELGQESVFWKMLSIKWLAGSGTGMATTTFLLANLWIVVRSAPPDAGLPAETASGRVLRRVVPWACIAVSVAAGVLVGRSVVLGSWQQLALWSPPPGVRCGRPALP